MRSFCAKERDEIPGTADGLRSGCVLCLRSDLVHGCNRLFSLGRPCFMRFPFSAGRRSEDNCSRTPYKISGQGSENIEKLCRQPNIYGKHRRQTYKASIGGKAFPHRFAAVFYGFSVSQQFSTQRKSSFVLHTGDSHRTLCLRRSIAQAKTEAKMTMSR